MARRSSAEAEPAPRKNRQAVTSRASTGKALQNQNSTL
jgi:hypothetical protein